MPPHENPNRRERRAAAAIAKKNKPSVSAADTRLRLLQERQASYTQHLQKKPPRPGFLYLKLKTGDEVEYVLVSGEPIALIRDDDSETHAGKDHLCVFVPKANRKGWRTVLILYPLVNHQTEIDRLTPKKHTNKTEPVRSQ